MSKYIIVVADAQRARFFTLKDSLTPEVESSPRLIEEQDLLNAEGANKGTKSRGTPASGRNQSGSGGSYAFDDHRSSQASSLRNRSNRRGSPVLTRWFWQQKEKRSE